MVMTLHKSRIELSFFSSVSFDLLGLLRTVCSQNNRRNNQISEAPVIWNISFRCMAHTAVRMANVHTEKLKTGDLTTLLFLFVKMSVSSWFMKDFNP